jgi:hypothetical protein
MSSGFSRRSTAFTVTAELAVVVARRVTLSLVVLALTTIAVVHPAVARKKSSPFTCTMAQIQSAQAQPCLKKQEQDAFNNVPYPHYVICENDGAQSVCGSNMCCCQKGHGCTALITTGMKINPGLLDGNPGFTTQGPAGTGTPVAPRPPTGGQILR